MHGRGILDATSLNGAYGVLKCHYASGVTISDLMLRTSQKSWMCYLYQSQYTTFDNVKIFGYGANNDGIAFQGSSGLEVKNCFIRSTDDCISLKSENLNKDANVTVSGSTMYGVASSDGIVAGYECKNRLNKITVKNCDIIGGRGTTILGYGHAGFSICCDGPGPIYDVTFENVRIENKVFENNMNIIVTDATKYLTGSLRGQPGSIRDITLKNVKWENAGMPMRIMGFNAEHTVSNVLFDNCYAGGVKIDANSLYYTSYIAPNVNEYTSDIRFR